LFINFLIFFAAACRALFLIFVVVVAFNSCSRMRKLRLRARKRGKLVTLSYQLAGLLIRAA